MNAHIKRLFTVVLAVLLLPTTAAMSQVYIEPGTFGSSLWQGEVANAAALSTCNADTASTIHWIVDTGRLAHCPSDGSDWVYYTFGGGGGGGDLGDLDNVDETGAATGEALVSDGAGAWLPSTAAAILEGDSRLTNTRTPTAHATSHQAGGSDVVVAATALALAANGTNCSAGSAPRGVDASGAAEDCTTYLTSITGEELADLSDVSAKSGTGTVVVTTTGAQTSGDCVEIDASGNHIASGAACGGGGGAVSIADLTSGTNTTMAGVIGSGASLAVSGSGTIAATTATSATNAAGIDSDADGTREVWGATVSTHPSVCLGPGDAGTCQARLSNYSGGSLYTPFVFSGGLFLGTSADAAESQWWARPLTSTRLQIMNMVYATALEIGHDGTRPYFSLYGAVYYGASATPPTCSTDGSVYTDTTEGSGLAAQCVCLDGAWEVMAGAGGCGTP